MISTSVKVSLDTRRPKADGTYPLILRLTHNRKTTSIKTGIHLKKEDWDEEKLEVKKSYKGTTNVTRLNNEIQKKKAEALDSILKLGDQKKTGPTTISDVKQKIDPSFTAASFYAFSETLIRDLYKADRVGTAQSYEGAVKFLRTFNKGKPLPKNKGGNPKASKFKPDKSVDLTFPELNYSFLMQLENYHLATGNERNGLAVYLRAIRSIYNKAIKSKVIDRELYPFADYKIKTEPTRKRALDSTSLSKILASELKPEHPAFDARNYFIASYMMYGMSFADMAHLQKKDIVDGRVHYRRQKTSKLYDIKITESLGAIVSHYIHQDPSSKYVFPIIKREGAILQQRDIQWARKRFNENLRSLADLCGIEQKLTSYVSRHSFATQAMLQNVPVTAISAMLGHSSLKTTEIYLKSLPSNVLDDYNCKILELKKD
ncbi:MAG TPA: site-specific integrase [Ferruginibacter sp.]|nr:site-specific integrase [Ferruginibacter sp.]